MLISDLCKSKKEELNITYQDIADKSNLPVSTVTYFLSQDAKAPSIYTAGPICAALGVSLDRYFNIQAGSEADELNGKIAQLEKRLRAHKKIIKILVSFI